MPPCAFCWVLAAGCWLLGAGCWVLAAGRAIYSPAWLPSCLLSAACCLLPAACCFCLCVAIVTSKGSHKQRALGKTSFQLQRPPRVAHQRGATYCCKGCAAGEYATQIFTQRD